MNTYRIKVVPKQDESAYRRTGQALPLCLGGERACPPEDSGGPSGYKHIPEVLCDPKHEEYNELSEWAGEDFDPEAFDLNAVNETLGSLP